MTIKTEQMSGSTLVPWGNLVWEAKNVERNTAAMLQYKILVYFWIGLEKV